MFSLSYFFFLFHEFHHLTSPCPSVLLPLLTFFFLLFLHLTMSSPSALVDLAKPTKLYTTKEKRKNPFLSFDPKDRDIEEIGRAHV